MDFMSLPASASYLVLWGGWWAQSFPRELTLWLDWSEMFCSSYYKKSAWNLQCYPWLCLWKQKEKKNKNKRLELNKMNNSTATRSPSFPWRVSVSCGRDLDIKTFTIHYYRNNIFLLYLTKGPLISSSKCETKSFIYKLKMRGKKSFSENLKHLSTK